MLTLIPLSSFSIYIINNIESKSRLIIYNIYIKLNDTLKNKNNSNNNYYEYTAPSECVICVISVIPFKHGN